MEWSYKQPVKIYFGRNKVKELGKIIEQQNFKKGVLITTKHFLKNGLASELEKNLENRIILIFDGFSPNPDWSEVEACADKIRENEIDFIVALGGGSVLDGAKAASVFSQMKKDEFKSFELEKEKLTKHLPVIAIPTTAGTGSEVTNVAVLSNREKNTKKPLSMDAFYPFAAIVDPVLTYEMPPYLTASTGMDVLCHAVEAFWSKGHQPICDLLAIHAANLVFQYIKRAYDFQDDEEAREKMAEASLLAGLAFGIPKTTAVHACSFPLTNIYGIPHGEACALTLDFFIRLNGKYDARTKNLAIRLGFTNVEEFANEVFCLKKYLNLRTSLKDFSLSKEERKKLIEKSHHPNLLNNPVFITDEELEELYEELS